MSVQDALAHAMQLHRNQRLVDAERTYRAILQVVPDYVDALHFLGLVMHQAGETEAGIELVTRAVTLQPDYVDALSNLGNLLRDQGHLEAAEETYRRTIACAPHPQAYNNLGVVLKSQGRYDEARIVLEQAIAIDPRRGDARFNLANVLEKVGRPEDARREYRLAIESEPMLVAAYDALAQALKSAGRDDEATAVLHELMRRAPDNPVARHMLAAFGDAEVPPRASSGYVEQTFDRFAETFEYVLGVLDYRAPSLIAAAIRELHMDAAQRLDVLDAGCGTGLCAPLLRPFARRLTGVDLSEGMLRKARNRKLYDVLARAELTQYLLDHPDAYDVIASADTLIYFGDLAPVAMAAAKALRSGGTLAFTLEVGGSGADLAGYELHVHGRYAHCADYVERTLLQAGLGEVRIARDTVRTQASVPVPGLIVTARKT